MFKAILVTTVALLTATAAVAHAAAKEDAQAAAKKLAQATNYSWKTTTESGFGSASEQGQAEKDGLIALSLTFFDNTTQAVKKGDKGAIKIDEKWLSFDEAEKSGQDGEMNPGRFLAMILRNHKLPAAVADELIANAREIKASNDGWTIELTEQGAKNLLSFGPSRQDGPQVSNAKGSATLTAKDGAIAKLEYKLEGTMKFGDQDTDVGRKVVVEIKDVGTTKVQAPPDAIAKIQGK